MPAKQLKFLADESLEYPVVIYLREEGCSVLSIAEDSPSISDKSVLKKAFLEKRIILTNDKNKLADNFIIVKDSKMKN